MYMVREDDGRTVRPSMVVFHLVRYVFEITCMISLDCI